MATPSVTWQDKFSTTLTSGIVASDTTIPLNALPTGSEGYLVIEPDSSTAYEIIYYTSKTGSAVVCPSAAAGRGLSGSTAASHSSGATVRMDTSALMLNALQDATGLTGVHTNNTNYGFDFVASGCVWTGDSYGASLAASMTSGVVYINGRRHTVAAVTARAFTTNVDTYIDALYSTVDNVATLVYTTAATNAASPALASNSVRIGIIQAGATITAATKVNQGQEDRVFPIASSIPYAVTDSLGNLICPRDPNRRILGYRQILATAQVTNTTTATQVTGLTVPVIIPTGRKIEVELYTPELTDQGNNNTQPIMEVWEGTVASGARRAKAYGGTTGAAAAARVPAIAKGIFTPASASLTYNAGIYNANATSNTSLLAESTAPAYLVVKLV